MGHDPPAILIPPPPGATARPLWDFTAKRESDPQTPLPKLRELRGNVFSWAEYNYLSNLVSLCGHNVRCACQISGLSRSRLYSLLKKYNLTPPCHIPVRQK
jgi:transcriptional regulator of acetoin/glycerol metabolism